MTADGLVRGPYAEITRWLAATPRNQLERRRHEAALLFHRIGITFAVHGEGDDPERLIRFDITPRVPEDEPYFRSVREGWSQSLREAYRAMPVPDWVSA